MMDEGHRRFRVSFAELQRMKMRKLQIKLVKDVVDMCENPAAESNTWEEDLQKYGKCLLGALLI